MASGRSLSYGQRYSRFVYVDRVVVAPACRARGYARLLYEDLFRHTAAAGRELVVCEVNVDPPNAASDALHAALGFAKIGMATIHGGNKTVRYLEKRISGKPDQRHRCR